MLNLLLSRVTGPLRILCIGAHCDDIEIGCGGALLELSGRLDDVRISCVVLSGNDARQAESRAALGRLVPDPGRLDIEMQRFRDGFFPCDGARIKEYFETIKGVNPDVIFTHYRADLHQDHRLVSDLTWNTFRKHLILEYEIPKYDGDLGNPSVYVEVREKLARAKAETLIDCFESQRGKDWFDKETFLSLMRLRGVEIRAASKYAEAFYLRKGRLSF